jgi:D-glutamate N-acetyltransferase
MSPAKRRAAGPAKVAILAEGLFTRATAKTAIGVLRYAPYPVVAVVDSTRAGTDAGVHVGVGEGVPVVATVDEAIALGAKVLLIGTAAAGGRIADDYRPHLARALERGIDVWNGLHERVLSDPVLAAAAARGKASVRELREPPPDLPIGGHRRPREGAHVVLTVGTDAAVGKMTVALELVRALERAGERAAFVATGQTGIVIAGKGISVDAVVADFIAGAAEQMVCEAAEEADWVIVEGQGSLTHPGFSGVTLGLLHGSGPDFMVLCHDAARPVVKGFEKEGLPLHSLSECVRIYEDAASWRRPPGHQRARVVAVAVNSAALDEAAARREIAGASASTKLPSADPIREGAAGADRLAAALLAAVRSRAVATSA